MGKISATWPWCLQKLCWEFALKQSSLFLEIIVNLDWLMIYFIAFQSKVHVSCFVKYPSRPRKNVWGKTLKQNQQTEAVLGCLAVLCSALLKLQGSTKFFHVWKWGVTIAILWWLFSSYFLPILVILSLSCSALDFPNTSFHMCSGWETAF